MDASMESLSLDNLRLSDGDDDDVARDREDSESSDHGDCRAPSRTSHRSTPPPSVWCSPRTVRQQPEVRLLLRDLERARTRGEFHDRDTPTRVPPRVRPFTADKLSSTGSSSRIGHKPDQKRPATSLGYSTGSALGHSTGSVPSTRTSGSSIDTSFDDSGLFSGSGSGSGSGSRSRSRRGTGRRRRDARSPGSFCNRVLSTTLVKGEEWAASKHRQMTFDPVLHKVTVHITNFRNPAEEVTLSMSYSSSVTSHNSRVVTDDIVRLRGRKEQLTREKAFKVEQRLAAQRKRRVNMAYARSAEMKRALKQNVVDPGTAHSAGLSAPRLLACDKASARLDRIRARTDAMTHSSTNTNTYLSLNNDL